MEVANEAWQNGFPGAQGVTDLREFAQYLGEHTDIPVAITSNHDGEHGFEDVYARSAADLATWHFSRDRGSDAGWRPVYDCWVLGDRPGSPPVISNEPIGPGSSVNSEREPVRLVMAAAFAYVAKLPAYVFHCEAGVFGRTRFEDTPAISQFGRLPELLPNDLPNWQRTDGKDAASPFTVLAGGKTNLFWSEIDSAPDGCLRNTGSRKGDQFVCVPIGIRPGGLELIARQPMEFTAFDPLTGRVLESGNLKQDARLKLPAGPGALILRGRLLPQP